MRLPRCSVIIPARNRSAILPAVLSSLVHQEESWERNEVVVVDNGSTDETMIVARSFSDRLPLKCISCAYHGGFEAAVARNVGAEAASGDVLIFLDSDIVVPPHFLTQHLLYHTYHDSACVIGSVVYVGEVPDIPPPCNVSGRASLNGYPDPIEKLALDFSERVNNKDYAWLLAHSGNLSTTRTLFVQAGRFDPAFTTWSIEDLDFGWRLQSIGVRFIYSRCAFGYHIPHSTSPPDEKRRTVRDGLRYMLQKYPNDTARIKRAAIFWEEETADYVSFLTARQFRTEAARRKAFEKLDTERADLAEKWLTLAIITWQSAEAQLLGRTLSALEQCIGEVPFEVLVINAVGQGSDQVERVLQLYDGPLPLRVFTTDWMSDRASLEYQRLMLRIAKTNMNVDKLLVDIEENLSRSQPTMRHMIDTWVQSKARGRVVRYLAPGDEPRPGWLAYLAQLLEVTGFDR